MLDTGFPFESFAYQATENHKEMKLKIAISPTHMVLRGNVAVQYLLSRRNSIKTQAFKVPEGVYPENR